MLYGPNNVPTLVLGVSRRARCCFSSSSRYESISTRPICSTKKRPPNDFFRFAKRLAWDGFCSKQTLASTLKPTTTSINLRFKIYIPSPFMPSFLVVCAFGVVGGRSALSVLAVQQHSRSILGGSDTNTHLPERRTGALCI